MLHRLDAGEEMIVTTWKQVARQFEDDDVQRMGPELVSRALAFAQKLYDYSGFISQCPVAVFGNQDEPLIEIVVINRPDTLFLGVDVFADKIEAEVIGMKQRFQFKEVGPEDIPDMVDMLINGVDPDGQWPTSLES